MTPSRPSATPDALRRLFAPFATRSYRFQWPADACTAWALEMETLILGWYILVETGSVLMLSVLGSLQLFGTLAAPMLGTLGDRWGPRRVLALMRLGYFTASGVIFVLAASGRLSPLAVLVTAGLAGTLKPSDIGLRTALAGATVPAPHLMSAMGWGRTSMDAAKVAGALLGTGVAALYGLAPAYAAIAALHLAGALLTLRADAGRAAAGPLSSRPSPWHELREGLSAVWRTPPLLAAMCLAALVNATAFPITNGLMPYVAREVFHVDARGLGWLMAAYAGGSLAGSLAMGFMGGRFGPGRAMLAMSLVWYASLAGFVASSTLVPALAFLAAAGIGQSTSMLALQMLLLLGTPARLRARIMGVRMLAIYPLPLGLLVAGALIPPLGFGATAALMLGLGTMLVLAIAHAWRHSLLPVHAAANARPAG